MRALRFVAALMLLALVVAPPVSAQGFLGRLKDKAKDKIDQHSDNAAQAVVDKADNAIVCAATDQQCIAKAKAEGKPVQVTDASGHPMTGSDSAAAVNGVSGESADPPGKGIWLNYDFVPGDRTIWTEDFSEDQVGDFPSRMQLVDGNFEVVTVNGHNWLHTQDGGWVVVVLPEKLPQRFTFEVDYWTVNGMGNPLSFETTYNGDGATWGCYHDNVWVDGGAGGGKSNKDVADPAANTSGIVTCRYTVDGKYIKGYMSGQRLANVPNANVIRGDSLIIHIPGVAAPAQVLVSNFRIAEGGKPLYQALMASGRVSTHGILFGSGSDQIQGESTPTLKQIGTMLQQHPDLKVLIEGHTDNQGAAAGNQTLSEKRAAAVKAYLVANYGVAAARLTTKGYGETKPVATNDTPEGRQDNRRVELVKM
ncbi:MAG TPA: OmpA family protein [Gemmatimonadales bacterium]|nr:OmpA family protein [Gemmatimonadales bacterium]